MFRSLAATFCSLRGKSGPEGKSGRKIFNPFLRREYQTSVEPSPGINYTPGVAKKQLSLCHFAVGYSLPTRFVNYQTLLFQLVRVRFKPGGLDPIYSFLDQKGISVLKFCVVFYDVLLIGICSIGCIYESFQRFSEKLRRRLIHLTLSRPENGDTKTSIWGTYVPLFRRRL